MQGEAGSSIWNISVTAEPRSWDFVSLGTFRCPFSLQDYIFIALIVLNNTETMLRSLLILICDQCQSCIRTELRSRHVPDFRNGTWKSAVLSFPFSATSCVVSHPRAHKEHSPLPLFSFLALSFIHHNKRGLEKGTLALLYVCFGLRTLYSV